MNKNVQGDFQICISVPLINTLLIVRNKQTSENRSAEAAIKIGVPMDRIKK